MRAISRWLLRIGVTLLALVIDANCACLLPGCNNDNSGVSRRQQHCG